MRTEMLKLKTVCLNPLQKVTQATVSHLSTEMIEIVKDVEESMTVLHRCLDIVRIIQGQEQLCFLCSKLYNEYESDQLKMTRNVPAAIHLFSNSESPKS